MQGIQGRGRHGSRNTPVKGGQGRDDHGETDGPHLSRLWNQNRSVSNRQKSVLRSKSEVNRKSIHCYSYEPRNT